MKTKYGYCAVTADFLHIGHIRYLKACSIMCRHLIVGIMTDNCIQSYKKNKPIMNQQDRAIVIKSIGFVYKTMFQDTFDFPHHIFRLKNHWGKDFIVFDGEEHSREGADILIPRTPNISSSLFKENYASFNLSQLPL